MLAIVHFSNILVSTVAMPMFFMNAYVDSKNVNNYNYYESEMCYINESNTYYTLSDNCFLSENGIECVSYEQCLIEE